MSGVSKLIETVKTLLIASISSSFVLNFVLAASLQQVVGMLGVLQVICVHSLLSIEFPQNAFLLN